MRSIHYKTCFFALMYSVTLYINAQSLSSKIQNTWWKMEKAKTWNCFLPGGKALTKFPDSTTESWKDLGGNKILFKGITYEIISVSTNSLVLKTGAVNFTFISQGTYAEAVPKPPAIVTKTAYKKEQAVLIYWKEKWYPGKIMEIKPGNLYLVSYDGYGTEWNETVGTDRLKKTKLN